MLDLRGRVATEESSSICSCSDIRDGPGTGGNGKLGGPVGGGLKDALVGVGGICDGGAGNASSNNGTGGRRERDPAVVVMVAVVVAVDIV